MPGNFSIYSHCKNSLHVYVQQSLGPRDPNPGFPSGCLGDVKSQVGHRTIPGCAG